MARVFHCGSDTLNTEDDRRSSIDFTAVEVRKRSISGTQKNTDTEIESVDASTEDKDVRSL